MKLIPNWKQVLLSAWSIYSTAIIILCTVVSAAIPFAAIPLNITPAHINIAVGCLGVVTLFVRLVDQQLGVKPPLG